MAYTFARVSAVVKLKRGDYSLQGKRARLRLLQKGGKEELVRLHHEAEQYLDSYLETAHISDAGAPMFQTLNKNHRLTGEGISRRDMLRVVRERCAAAELPESICNHTFRGTGITVFLQNGGSPGGRPGYGESLRPTHDPTQGSGNSQRNRAQDCV
jgi:integrase/recombinase XerD